MTRLPDPERSRAFLFGTASYEADELADLPAVGNNLTDLRAALTSPLGAFAEERCTVLLDPPGAIPVYDALRHHAAEATDTLLIYFAGHGLRKLRGGLYLALPHTQFTNAAVSGFDYDLLREIVNSSRATNKIVIVDSCFSGRAIPGMSGGTAGLAQELDIEGSCLLTATTANEQALALPGERYTAFTGQLLHLLRSGRPEAGPLLSLGVLGEELRRSARRRELPMPEQQFRGTTQHIALARNPAASTAGAPPPAVPVAPPSRPSAAHAFVSRALVLAGTEHATKKDLASTIRKHWATAADRFFRRMGTESHPSESWSQLRSWLRQFNDHRADDVEGRIVLIDTYLTDPALPPDHKLLRLLQWLDPDGPVVYRSCTITYASLARICLHPYSGGDEPDAELLEVLARPHEWLLDTLAEFPTLDRLRNVRRTWHKALKAWRDADTTLWPPEVRDWAADIGPGAQLAALLPPEALTEIRNRLPDRAQPPDPSMAWYDRLLQAAGGRDTLLGRLAEAEWSEQARQEALTVARERERRLRQQREAEQRRQAKLRHAEEEARQWRLRQEQEARRWRLRERAWQAREAARMRPAARVLAVLRALALGAAWALAPVVAVWVSWWFSSYEYGLALLLTALLCTFGLAALCRLVPSALRLGGAFRPRLRAPSTWLPPARTALAAALLLTFGLLADHAMSPTFPEYRVDSDLLREAGLSEFLNLVNSDSFSVIGGEVFVTLILLPASAGCVWIGLQAGLTTARRWDEKHARARQEAHRGPQ
ncbi:caspase family protein [Streptomyces sp. NPDC046862]|uniref:caspase, EACC1-associated type n=1 Tax=Streptomyces sp. NPDC046862 TaxID=3154603 RepID=UPI0034570891